MIFTATIPIFFYDSRYIQVETAFFWRWWRVQTPDTKQLVKQLVDRGQFEFIGMWHIALTFQ